MRTKRGILLPSLAMLLLPVGSLAGRLDGEFGTTQEGAPPDANEACIEIDGEEFDASGAVTGAAGSCQVVIGYNIDLPSNASASNLIGGKTRGLAKVSQKFFVPASVDVGDALPLDCPAENEFSGTVDVWKCQVSASIRGTAAAPPDDDTLQAARVRVTCYLGEDGSDIDTDPMTDDVQSPTEAQFQAVLDAFADRDDVTLGANGKLSIRQTGVADTTSPFGGCAP